MSIILFDPVCEPEVIDRRAERSLEGRAGKKVGYVFNQHKSALVFWQTLEQEMEKQFGAMRHRVRDILNDEQFSQYQSYEKQLVKQAEMGFKMMSSFLDRPREGTKEPAAK